MSVVISEKIGHITIIRMNFESRMNSMEKGVRDGLKQHLKDFANDENSRVAILTGSGKVFSAGGSLTEFKDGLDANDGYDFMKGIDEIILLITRMAKPVIASVNGVAVGAGFNLALACDLIVASSTVKFSQIFSKVGLIPDLGGLYFLPRIIGMHKAKELIFTAKMINADEALEMGLVNHVVSPEDLMPYTLKIAEKIAGGPMKAISFSKTLMAKSFTMTLEDILEYEAFAQAVCFQSHDHKEGCKAFFENREPEFKGK